ncbi:MAG: hypothetical protein EOO01_36345, partial [Chitinophagaceae bacterium]
MNQAHVHLMVTHLPIVGTMLGILVFAFAIWRKSEQTKNAAYLLFILCAFGAIIAYLTGEGTEEIIENQPGISEMSIEQHEEFAIYSLTAVILLGCVSAIFLFFQLRGKWFKTYASAVIIVLSIMTFGLMV